MTLEQLITLDAIVKSGSFKAAATVLNKSQPSISVSVKNLENEYGIKIFSRDQYRPVLTYEGKLFLEKGQKILEEMKKLDSLGKELGQGKEALIRIGIDSVSPIGLILHILKKFFKDHPQTRLDLKFEVLGGTIERLIDGDVDLCLTHVMSPLTNIEAEPVTKIKMIPVVSPELIGKNKITKELLQELTQIVVKDTSRHTPTISFGLLSGNKQLTISDGGLKKQLILEGLGWGSLPEEIIGEELKKKKLIAINTQEVTTVNLPISLMRDKHKPHGPVASLLWDQIKELARECR
ncbi:MAG: LysR family transcriptional regulator [Bacteriovoracaceae bacterium]